MDEGECGWSRLFSMRIFYAGCVRDNVRSDTVLCARGPWPRRCSAQLGSKYRLRQQRDVGNGHGRVLKGIEYYSHVTKAARGGYHWNGGMMQVFRNQNGPRISTIDTDFMVNICLKGSYVEVQENIT